MQSQHEEYLGRTECSSYHLMFTNKVSKDISLSFIEITISKMCKGLFPPKELGPQKSENHATSHNGGKEGERFNDDLPQTSTNVISDV